MSKNKDKLNRIQEKLQALKYRREEQITERYVSPKDLVKSFKKIHPKVNADDAAILKAAQKAIKTGPSGEGASSKILLLMRSYLKKEGYKGMIGEAYNSAQEYGTGGHRRAVNSIMKDPIDHVDSSDVRPVSQLDDPDTFARMNSYVQRANCICADPWKIVRNLYYKLHIVGLNFDLPHGEMELPTEDTTYIFDLYFHGGSYGPKPDGEWTDDDGFDGTYALAITLDPCGDGMWELEAEIIRGDEIEMDENLTDVMEGCDCESCTHKEELEEGDEEPLEESYMGLDGRLLEIVNVIEEDNHYFKVVDSVTEKLQRRGAKRYDRRQALKMYKNAIYKVLDMMEDDRSVSDLEVFSVSASGVLQMAEYFADMFEEDLDGSY